VPATSVDALIAGRHFGMKVCYLRDGDRVFETYWITGRGCEIMGNSYGMLDMTVYGRQEPWEDSPEGLAAEGARRRLPQQRAANLAVVPPGGRPLRRPQHRRALRGRSASVSKRGTGGAFRLP
jgi:hypothetical protein